MSAHGERGTARERSAAEAMIAKFTSKFTLMNDAPLLPTTELMRRLRGHSGSSGGGGVVLVDVRTTEEQRVSMIPGAVTRETFENEVLPKLRESGDTETLIVPYCTVGYRSGIYCRELISSHGLRNVRNGEGVIMWTFDGGSLVRPAPPPHGKRATGSEAISRAPNLKQSNDEEGTASSAQSSGRPPPWQEPQGSGCGTVVVGKPRVIDAEAAEVTPEVVKEVHVYGKPWDCAAEGYSTVYFSNRKGAVKFISEQLRSKKVRTAALWAWALSHFYFLFTPMCGAMYKCGCRLALSKWGQVETCNVYDDHAGAHKCPWCSCSGLSCIFVAFDSRAFRGVFLLDLLPDGCCVTMLTVAVLFFSWRRMDRLSEKHLRPGSCTGSTAAVKAVFATSWFFAYCLLLGAIFYAADTEYPYFLGWTRSVAFHNPGVADMPANTWSGVPGRLMINASDVQAKLASGNELIILDARTRAAAQSTGIIPGAALVPWEALSEGGPPEAGRKSVLRPPAGVFAVLAAVGADVREVGASRLVVVYGSWDAGWGEEGRLFWTLEYLGFDSGSLKCLQGGIRAWQDAGYSLEAPNANTPDATFINEDESLQNFQAAYSLAAGVEYSRRATTELVHVLNTQGRLVLLDTRELNEYEGIANGDPYGAARSGHLPGAIAWPWKQRMFDQGSASGPPPLRSCEEIEASLPSEAANSAIVSYCTGGIRSGFVYMVLRGCGHEDVRNYDGSWWAWAADLSLPCVGHDTDCAEPGSQEAAAAESQGSASGQSGGSGAM